MHIRPSGQGCAKEHAALVLHAASFFKLIRIGFDAHAQISIIIDGTENPLCRISFKDA